MVIWVLLVIMHYTLHVSAGESRLVMDGSLVIRGSASRRKLQQESRLVMVEVLGELKRSIDNDPSGVLDSWDVDNTTAADPCRDEWSGLICDAQGVQLLAINLSAKQLRGTLTPSLSLLPLRSLTSLDLSDNHLTLSSDYSNLSSLIPPSLSLLNLSYTNITNGQRQLSRLLINASSDALQHLWLDGTQLSGSLPEQLDALQLSRAFPSLLTLSLSHNSLTGMLPAAAQQLLSCDYLTRLDLSYNNLSGALNSWCSPGSNLSATLTYLDVSYNKLQGVIPTTLANCSALQHLDLGYNGLRGTLPSALPLLCRNLAYFNVRYNSGMLSGPLPGEFALLSRLQDLDLEGNNFSGTPLPIISNCSALRTIHFYGNKFSGRIPSDLCARLPNLNDVVLGNNSFSGPLPPALANCSSFTNLVLGFNKFSGTISGVMLGKWSQLQRQLDLQSNSLTGSIPPQIGNLTNLERLILNNNHFSGSFPREMGLLSSLEGATFEDNSFSGSFPGQIFNCTRMKHLIIHDNYLHGPLPTSIGQAAKLAKLQAENNLLSGDLPSALSNCTQLQNFSLAHNHLTGSIPGYLASMPNIAFVFNLSHNNFSGVIPTGFGNKDLMQGLDLSHNKLSGQVPADLSLCAGLQTLNLAANLLEGSIPSSFGGSLSLTSLTLLNLSFNSLSGSIPESLGEMRSLQALDLSENQLEGLIPVTFSTAPALVFLNLSYNNLQGTVPKLFANATASSFLGNPQLCGAILHRSCSHRSVHALGKTAKIGLIVGVAVVGTIALVLLAGFVIRRRRIVQRQSPPPSPNSKLRKLHMYQIKEATNNFSAENLMGTGASGSVFKGVMPDGEVLAFKKFTNMESKSIHAFFRELETVRQIKHRNLIKILGYWSDHIDDNILILEYMQNGSLEDHLHLKGNEPRSCKLTWEERWHIAIAIGEGLLYLHEDCPNSPIVHCDIKPSNILFDDKMQVHISDFGLAKIVVDMVTTTQNMHGTLGYMAPECASSGHISPKGDVYSFGILILELMSGIRPTDTMFLGDGMTLMEWAHIKFRAGLIHELLDETMASAYEKGCDDGQIDILINIALECTRENPRARPTMKEVLPRLRHIVEKESTLKFSKFGELLDHL